MITNIEQLAAHADHNIRISRYKDKQGNLIEATVECLDCGEVIISGETLAAERAALYSTVEAVDKLNEMLEDIA